MFENVLKVVIEGEGVHTSKTPFSSRFYSSVDSRCFGNSHTSKYQHSDSGLLDESLFRQKETQYKINNHRFEKEIRGHYRIVDDRTLHNLPYPGEIQNFAATQNLPSTSEFRSRLSRYDSIVESPAK